MKRTGELQDRVRDLTSQIERSLLSLEQEYREGARKIEEVMTSANELVKLCARTPGESYVRERALRLQAVLKRYEEKYRMPGSLYTSLHRQIHRIQDSVLSDYFSPSLNRALERLVKPEPPVAANEGTALPLLHLYSLDGLLFGVYGKLIKHLRNRDMNTAHRIRMKEGNLIFFPEKGDSSYFKEEADDMRDLLSVKKEKGRNFHALWCDELLESRKEDPAEIRRRIEPLSMPHRHITGRVRMNGRVIYWIDHQIS